MQHPHGGMPPPHGAPQEALLHFGLSGTTRPIDSIQQVADHFGKYAPCQIQGQGEYEGLLRFLVIFTGPNSHMAVNNCRREETGRSWPYDPNARIHFFDHPPPGPGVGPGPGPGPGPAGPGPGLGPGPGKGAPDLGKGKGDGKGMGGYGDPNFGGKGDGKGMGMDYGKGNGKGGKAPGDDPMPPRPVNPESELCVHIGNIDPATDVFVLRNLFRSYGTVVGFDVAPMQDHRGSSAVIEYSHEFECGCAVWALHRQSFNGWNLTVEHPRSVANLFLPGQRCWTDPQAFVAKGKGRGGTPGGPGGPDPPGYPAGGDPFKGGKGGPGKGGFDPSPSPVVFVYNFPADMSIDQLRDWVQQRVSPVAEIRCFSQPPEEVPDRRMAGFAFIDMTSTPLAEAAVREINQQGQWRAHHVNADIRRQKFPRLASTPEDAVFELRIIVSPAGSIVHENQLASLMQPAFSGMSPPAAPLRFQKSTFGQHVYYVRFASVGECQNVFRQRDAIARYDPGHAIAQITLADPCLRPEALDDLSGGAGRGPPGGYDGMPPAKRGRFDGGPGFMGKQFRPVRNPRDVVDLASAFHRAVARGRPHPKPEWDRHAQGTVDRLIKLIFHHMAPLNSAQPNQIAAEVRACVNRQDIMALLKDELVRNMLIRNLEHQHAAMAPPPVSRGNGLNDLVNQRNQMSTPSQLPTSPPPAGTVWTGTVARNNGKHLGVHGVLITGGVDGYVLPEAFNIQHRSPLEEVAKRPATAIIQLKPDAAKMDAYKEYINYFTKKKRAGLVNIQSTSGEEAGKAQLFIMPPCAALNEILERAEITVDDLANTILCILSPNADAATKEAVMKAKATQEDPLVLDDKSNPSPKAASKPASPKAAASPKKDGSPKRDGSPAPASPKAAAVNKDGSPKVGSPAAKSRSPSAKATKRKSPSQSPKKAAAPGEERTATDENTPENKNENATATDAAAAEPAQ